MTKKELASLRQLIKDWRLIAYRSPKYREDNALYARTLRQCADNVEENFPILKTSK